MPRVNSEPRERLDRDLHWQANDISKRTLNRSDNFAARALRAVGPCFIEGVHFA